MSNKKTFLDLIGKKDFMKRIVELQDEKEVIKEFENEGVAPTEDEMEALKNILNRTCDELAKHNKEELKEMKDVFDNLTEQQLLAVAGGGKKGEETEESGYFDKEIEVINDVTTNVEKGAKGLQRLVDSARKLGGAAKGLFQPFLDSQTRKNEAQIVQSNNATEQQKSNNNTKVALACIGAATVITPLYIFKDDIKAWFRRK